MSLAFQFLLLGAIWGASFLLMRMGAADFGPFLTSFLRVLLAALLLLPLLVWKGQWPALRRHAKPILFLGVINSGIPFALFAFAVLHISTGLSSILNATAPLWSAVVAWLWLRDKPAPWRIVGLVVGFAGVAALSWGKASFKSGAASAGWAVLACLVATLLYGVAANFIKKYLQGVPPLAIATGTQVGATLVLAVPGLATAPAQMPGPQAWGAVFLLALVCTALAYVLFFRLIERAGAARAVTVTFIIPVFGVMYGAVLLGEPITVTMLVCGAVILLGTALATGVLNPAAAPRQPKPRLG